MATLQPYLIRKSLYWLLEIINRKKALQCFAWMLPLDCRQSRVLFQRENCLFLGFLIFVSATLLGIFLAFEIAESIICSGYFCANNSTFRSCNLCSAVCVLVHILISLKLDEYGIVRHVALG